MGFSGKCFPPKTHRWKIASFSTSIQENQKKIGVCKPCQLGKNPSSHWRMVFHGESWGFSQTSRRPKCKLRNANVENMHPCANCVFSSIFAMKKNGHLYLLIITMIIKPSFLLHHFAAEWPMHQAPRLSSVFCLHMGFVGLSVCFTCVVLLEGYVKLGGESYFLRFQMERSKDDLISTSEAPQLKQTFAPRTWSDFLRVFVGSFKLFVELWWCFFLDLWYTPLKINMEPQNGGLEDDFPFLIGSFSGSMWIFQGVRSYQRGPFSTEYQRNIPIAMGISPFFNRKYIFNPGIFQPAMLNLPECFCFLIKGAPLFFSHEKPLGIWGYLSWTKGRRRRGTNSPWRPTTWDRPWHPRNPR